ncbi:hypothetical protein AgCh_013541 [Apium graveolens]
MAGSNEEMKKMFQDLYEFSPNSHFDKNASNTLGSADSGAFDKNVSNTLGTADSGEGEDVVWYKLLEEEKPILLSWPKFV